MKSGEVDGPGSLALRLDNENPNQGRYSACRRVARAVFMGATPTLSSANKGLDIRQINLGCVQPGESVAVFSDALRKLTDQSTYMYVHTQRYWYDIHPSVSLLKNPLKRIDN